MAAFTFSKNRELAARAGRISMRKKTESQFEAHQARAANALLQQQGIGYYRAMGKRSAQARALKRGL